MMLMLMMMMMMKCALVLVLLHFSNTLNTNVNVNTEIIKKLKLNRTNFSYPVRIPSEQMRQNASSCVGVFVAELRALLRNATVHEGNSNRIDEVQRNLDLLHPQQQNETAPCTMETTMGRKPLRMYISFLQKLNSSKK